MSWAAWANMSSWSRARSSGGTTTWEDLRSLAALRWLSSSSRASASSVPNPKPSATHARATSLLPTCPKQRKRNLSKKNAFFYFRSQIQRKKETTTKNQTKQRNKHNKDKELLLSNKKLVLCSQTRTFALKQETCSLLSNKNFCSQETCSLLSNKNFCSQTRNLFFALKQELLLSRNLFFALKQELLL
jgi:hypothetical protein